MYMDINAVNVNSKSAAAGHAIPAPFARDTKKPPPLGALLLRNQAKIT